MKTFQTAEQIYQAKERRRKRLAALPIDEKVEIIEKLREMGLAMREARQTLPKAATTDDRSEVRDS